VSVFHVERFLRETYVPDRAPDVAGFILLSILLGIVVLPVVMVFWV